MLAELGRLTGSKSVRSVVVTHPVDIANLNLPISVHWGVDVEELDAWERYLASGDFSDNPLASPFVRIVHRSYVRTRLQWCSDHTWYNSSYFNEFRRPIRSDHLMNCNIALPGMGAASLTSFTRALGDKPYSRQDALVAGLFHNELRRIWRKPFGASAGEARLVWTPRQQQILTLMIAGDAEKQIAVRLRLSRHTVHNYIRAMYRKIGVGSRAELLAATNPPPIFRPRILPL
jgi:DNA-binding CsgD family transcriptional regulator